MKICPNCEAEFDTQHYKCQECRGVKPMAISSKNFKWKVSMKVCDKGHNHIPNKKGECGVCVGDSSRLCGYCKEPLMPHKHKFCSGHCQYMEYNKKLTDKECKHCEKQLRIGQYKFCSWQCNADYKSNISRLMKQNI